MNLSNTVHILEDLIKLPAFVDMNTNANESAVIDYVTTYLKSHTKLKVEKQLVEKNRYNIIAYSNLFPDIILFGHMDTVPPKVETTTPLVPVVKNGRLYGLGSVDMKAGLAVMLDIAEQFKDSTKIAFVLTVDEEYEFKGAYKLIEKYKFNPSYIINIEPTDLGILNGCRGVTEFEFVVHGVSCHAGTKDLGKNAIEKAVELCTLLQADISKLNVNGGINSLNLAYLNGGILTKNGQVSYSGNVVPNYANVVTEIRIANPKITTDHITKRLNMLTSKLNVTTSNLRFKFLVGSSFTPREKLKEFDKALETNGIKPIYKNINATGYFEVQLLQDKWGGNVVVFGPGPSALAHCINEYVDINTVTKTQDVITTFIKSRGADK